MGASGPVVLGLVLGLVLAQSSCSKICTSGHNSLGGTADSGMPDTAGISSINKGIKREKFIDSIIQLFGKYVYVFIYDFI